MKLNFSNRWLPAAMVTLLLVSVLLPQCAQAVPMYLENLDEPNNDFISKYPTWKGSCITCHITNSSPKERNPYGQAFEKAKKNSGQQNIPGALSAIAGQDSDGDGFSNEMEIWFNAFPGDPNSKPALPGGVNASDGTFTDKVRITWSSYPNATFELHRADSPNGAKTKIANTPSTSYDDATAVAGTNYQYWVKACNKAGCTGFSSPDAGSRKVAEAPAPKPSGLTKTVDLSNPATLKLLLPNLPDLTVKSCKDVKQTANTVVVTISNVGGSAAAPTKILFTITGFDPTNRTNDVPAIPPGQSVQVTFDGIKPMTKGPHNSRMYGYRVNWKDTIKEASAKNNGNTCNGVEISGDPPGMWLGPKPGDKY